MIFLDNASTTCLCDEAKSEIEKSHDLFYNPSAVYGKSLEIRKKLDEAKQNICRALGVSYNNNLIITGSATEANNLAIFGSIKKTDSQLVFGAGEHPSVYNCALELKARGFNVVFAPLAKTGEIDLEILSKILEKPTAFVSIMTVSNETGAINNIQKISKLVRKTNPNAIFHSDGVQAFGKISTNVLNMDVDLFSISAHKIGGPKGIGALYVKNIKKLKPIIFGGGQEFGLRSGTENTMFTLAFGAIAKCLKIKENFEKTNEIRNYVRNFFENKDGVEINSPKDASPYVLSLSFCGVRGETLVHVLEGDDVIIGTGSACSSKKGALNRTLEEMGKTKEENEGAVRISFSKETTLDEVKQACNIIYDSYLKLKEKLK